MTPEVFLTKSMQLVESKATRQWVTTEHNYPIFIEMAALAIKKGLPEESLAGYIMCLALDGPGL